MKIKNVLGIMAVMALSVCCTATAYAADNNSYSIGKPISMATGEVLDNLKAGDKIMVPVDFVSTDDHLEAYTAQLRYDTSVLKVGLNESELTDAEYNVLADKGGPVYINGRDKVIGSVNTFGSWSRFGFSHEGSPTFNEPEEGYIINLWYTDNKTTTIDNVESYICFNVLADIPSDKLNYILFTPMLGKGDSTVNNFAQLDTATAEKANACYGAFNVVLDATKMDGWVQALTLKVGSASVNLEKCIIDGDTFTFPVRITSNNGNATEAEIEVVAKITPDEEGAGTASDVSLGKATVKLDSPSAYTNAALTK